MNRRSFLGVAGLTGIVGVAGCGGLFETRSIRSPPLVEDRPDAVYYPSHVEGMAMIGSESAGRYGCTLTYSFPHRFWLVTGEERTKVSVGSTDSIHLMASVWDRRTDAPLIGGSVDVRIERDGEVVSGKPPWPMLSQNMGVHFGDNYALSGDGTYGVSVDLEPVGVRTTGELADAFDGAGTVSFEFDFSRAGLRDLRFRRLDRKKGTRGAVKPMEMGMAPTTRLASPDALPGEVLGETAAGDGVFVVTRLDESPAGIDASGPYLAASARTPYNRYPLPMTSLSARVERDGETRSEAPLIATLDPDLGYHYGATVESLEPGDAIELSPGASPQIARHEGYETAFFGLSEMRVTV